MANELREQYSELVLKKLRSELTLKDGGYLFDGKVLPSEPSTRILQRTTA